MPAVTVSDYGGIAGQPLGASGKSPQKLVFGTFNPGTYATSGVALTGLTNRFTVFGGVLFVPHAANDFIYNSSTGKVLAYVKATGAEVANSTDLSAITLQFIAWGTV